MRYNKLIRLLGWNPNMQVSPYTVLSEASPRQTQYRDTDALGQSLMRYRVWYCKSAVRLARRTISKALSRTLSPLNP